MVLKYVLKFRDILTNYKAGTIVVMIPEGTVIPQDLILIHEHGDHYSLQTSVPILPSELNSKLTRFLKPFESFPKEDYFERFPIL